MRSLPVAADATLRVEQSGTTLTVVGSEIVLYPLDGRTENGKIAGGPASSQTKWEGSALLVNTLVSGPRNFTIMERWRRSRDGATLTIRRTVVDRGGERESTLVYESGAARPQLATRTPAGSAGSAVSAGAGGDYVVAAGTRVLLRLTNSVNTKRTAAGDRLYLETVAPVYVNGRLVIPVGSYVTGVVTESKQAGRVKGRAALALEFDSLTLRSGVQRDLRARPSTVDTAGNLDRSEGRIQGEGTKAKDAGTVAQTTAGGTAVGTMAGAAAGRVGMGAGIGAAAGAAGGLASVLATRGKEVMLPQGTTMELVVNHDLRFTDAELSLRAQ